MLFLHSCLGMIAALTIEQFDAVLQAVECRAFSAGGHITWLFLFSHADLLAGAALASANYDGMRCDIGACFR